MKVINVINRLFRTSAYAVVCLSPISQELCRQQGLAGSGTPGQEPGPTTGVWGSHK